MIQPGIEPDATATTDVATHLAPWLDPVHPGPFPTLIVGAGLSFGLTPTAEALARRMREDQHRIEQVLGIAAGPDISNADGLYEWADHCLAQLQSNTGPGLSAIHAKRRLAEAMGLLLDREFLALTAVPPRGATPRHRALARLAREGRINAVVSLNWDCWLEAAFRSVGMQAGTPTRRRFPASWNSHYKVWFKGQSYSAIGQTQALLKVHGCLAELHGGRGDFLIGKSELDRPLADEQSQRLTEAAIQGHPLITLGWSASEGHVRALFTAAAEANALSHQLSIVDIFTENPNYDSLLSAYQKERHQATVGLNRDSPGTTDDLMLWIQTRRGLSCLREACHAQPAKMEWLGTMEQGLPGFRDRHMPALGLVSFFDSWLPVWLRTCFLVRAKVFDGVQPGSEAVILPADERDAHLPWGYPLNDRPDLEAAAQLLQTLIPQAANIGTMEPWDFETFPGALWDGATQRLVVAVPIWADTEHLSHTRLKPLIESAHWSRRAMIRELYVLPLQRSGQADMPDLFARRQALWKEALAACFGNIDLATGNAIKHLLLEDLQGLSAN